MSFGLAFSYEDRRDARKPEFACLFVQFGAKGAGAFERPGVAVGIRKQEGRPKKPVSVRSFIGFDTSLEYAKVRDGARKSKLTNSFEILVDSHEESIGWHHDGSRGLSLDPRSSVERRRGGPSPAGSTA